MIDTTLSRRLKTARARDGFYLHLLVYIWEWKHKNIDIEMFCWPCCPHG